MLQTFLQHALCFIDSKTYFSTINISEGFVSGSAGKESVCNAGDVGSILGLRRSPGEWCGNPLQYSCLENPHRPRSLEGYSPWGHKESYVTERLSTTYLKSEYTL